MMRRLVSVRTWTLGALLALASVSILGVACGGSDSGDGVAGGGALPGKGGSSGKGGTSGAGGSVNVGGSGGGGSCQPACSGDTFCSKNGSCIATGTCAVDGDCAAGLICDPTTSTCVPGGGCGQSVFKIEAVAPNMFISLDRSCSMTGAGGGGKTKWEIAVASMNQMLTSFNGKIRWGLGLFPDKVTPNCQQAAPQFAVADGNEPKIQALLTASLQSTDPFYPSGPCVTNIDTAIVQASQEPAFADKTRKSYVLLMTDGAQAVCPNNQGDPLTIQTIKTMAAAGVNTFVIGFGSGVKASSLNAFADAGGVPNNDPAAPTTHYYQASDSASLDAALGKIAGSIVGCSFTLSSPPPDPTKLYVFFDKVGVTRDATHQSGWDYDPSSNQLTFYGGDCDKLKQNLVSKVDVVYGCNQPPPG